MKASQQKSLAGLDNTTAGGLSSFRILADIVKKYFAGNKGIVDNVERENNILKLDLPSIVLIIPLAHHIVSILLYQMQLIQFYARTDNVILKITILFVNNAAIYIEP